MGGPRPEAGIDDDATVAVVVWLWTCESFVVRHLALCNEELTMKDLFVVFIVIFASLPLSSCALQQPTQVRSRSISILSANHVAIPTTQTKAFGS